MTQATLEKTYTGFEPLCPACAWRHWSGALEYQELARIAIDQSLCAETVHYRACERCGLIGKFPLPSERGLKDYYGTTWQYHTQRPGYEAAAHFIAEGLASAEGAGKFPMRVKEHRLKLIGDGLCLDVGSKGNPFIAPLRAAGIDLEDGGGLDCQPQRANVSHGWLGDGKHERAEHSLVCAAHVLEHVLHPDLFLDDLARLTADLGYIYIEVPSLRGGIFDVGLCDDLNRNHLWHFGLQALALLANQVGTLVALKSDISLPGWPVDRLLIRKAKPAQEAIGHLGLIQRDIWSEYQKAGGVLADKEPRLVGLYGASHSYLHWRAACPHPMRFRLFDKFKAGQKIDRHPIESIEALRLSEIGTVYVTTRSYNSYVDIKRDLSRELPHLLVKTPYSSIAAACGEELP